MQEDRMAAINFRLSNVPPVTRATLVLSFILSLLCAAFRYRLYMAQVGLSSDAIPDTQTAVPLLMLIPAASYLFPWTFVTTVFVHTNILSVRSLSELR